MHARYQEIRTALETSRETAAWISRRFDVSALTVAKIASGVERAPCGCGRPASHKGHCSYRLSVRVSPSSEYGREAGARLLWSEAADRVLHEQYALGDDIEVVRAALLPLIGDMSKTAIYCRTEKLGLKRPPEFRARLGREGRCGRPLGSKNKQPYVRVGYRPTKYRTVPWASEVDEIYAWLVTQEDEAAARDLFRWHARSAAEKTTVVSEGRSSRHPGVYRHPAEVMDAMLLRRLDRRPVSNVTLPTVRRDPVTKGVPYRMASSGSDPLRAARLAQLLEGRRGQL